MRLANDEIITIKTNINSYFQEPTIYLFGSRIDDTKKITTSISDMVQDGPKFKWFIDDNNLKIISLYCCINVLYEEKEMAYITTAERIGL